MSSLPGKADQTKIIDRGKRKLVLRYKKMLCPFCNSENSRVLESRTTEEAASIRRRRECENPSCNKRFTTYERVEVMPVLVVKRSGEREPYSREKLRAGLVRACEKTLITAEQMDTIIENIENELVKQGKREVNSTVLGELVLNELKDLDQVAYVRFASVYRQFRSIDDFIKELQNLHSDSNFKLKNDDFIYKQSSAV